MSISASTLRKKSQQIKTWLTERGAEVLKPTNDYELLRFRTANCTSVVYVNKADHLSYVGEAFTALTSYLTGGDWRAETANARKKKSSVVMRSIRARDGDLCFFCQVHVHQHEESVEHLVPITAGGPNHISNLFLAHRECNDRAGSMSAAEKIKIHVEAVLGWKLGKAA